MIEPFHLTDAEIATDELAGYEYAPQHESPEHN